MEQIASIAEGSTEYTLVSALITSDRITSEVEISAVVNEFVIYEHIEKPYLTMRLTFTDQINIVQTVDFQGGEKISITLKQIEELQTSNEIKKDFVIDEIEKVIKVDERNELVVIHCTEYHMFEAASQNVNKSYTGSPSDIINALVSTYINKSLVVDGDDSTKNLKVIIPNLDPIEASLWIKKRAVTYNGMPFFLYSPLGVDNLVFKDLGKMLSEPVTNVTTPYIFSSSLAQTTGASRLYSIIRYKYEDSEDLIRLISKLPGLGPKSAKRIVLKLINNREELIKPMAKTLAEVYKNVSRCKICGTLKSNSIECSFSDCNFIDNKFDKICVVENISDQWSIESSNIYKGYFHILGGTISSAGQNKEDLLVSSLVERVKKDKIKEVILATSATVEGQTTAYYIQDSLKNLNIKITKLAQGLPVGGEIESLDDGTLNSAFKNRTTI